MGAIHPGKKFNISGLKISGTGKFLVKATSYLEISEIFCPIGNFSLLHNAAVSVGDLTFVNNLGLFPE